MNREKERDLEPETDGEAVHRTPLREALGRESSKTASFHAEEFS